ncbi:unnamed protein product [Meloidogyne enterolobii]|uniref:Uncharacterized protein n=1 Tax=Meloidogyne enterolobii TaxID=390850 RepID=A0ACB0Z140_MELEN
MNIFHQVFNHEYSHFCVRMLCSTIERGYQVIRTENSEEFILENNNGVFITTPDNCNLDFPINFFITHVVNYDLNGQHCFANGGVVEKNNYTNWPQMSMHIKKFENRDYAEGTIEIVYFTKHSLKPGKN